MNWRGASFSVRQPLYFWRGAAGNTSHQTRRLCDEGKLPLLAWLCVGAVFFFCLEQRLRGIGLGRFMAKGDVHPPP